ncbi:MAG: plasmid stabilization system [Clostridia bacterium]|nr:plasmid stabilization system [Clostridia bacterium]
MIKAEKISDLSKEELLELNKIFAKNWLAHDGLWFQSIEEKHGMDMAIDIDMDREAWRRSTVIEARRLPVQKQVLTGISKVSKNPLPHPQGYGKPLGNKGGNNLTGFFKIRYRDIGIRVVYSLALETSCMNILIISERDDNYCYNMAARLYEKYGDRVFEDIFETLE